MPNPDGDDNDSRTDGEQVRVSFTLSSEIVDRSLEVASEPIAVPANIGRKGLTAVINHLLDRKVTGEDDEESESDEDGEKLPAISFDFMLEKNNRLLRTGVEREARRHGLSLEQTISIIYFPAQEAPELFQESEKAPDWISCMSFVKSSHDLLCTAAYDGSVLLYHPYKSNASDEMVLDRVALTSNAHSGPIKCLDAVVGNDDENLTIATGSLDQTVVVHSFNLESKEIRLDAKCEGGHLSSIGSVDLLGGSSKLLASGDWDGMVSLWDLSSPLEELQTQNGGAPSKKLKTGSMKSGQVVVSSITPKASFQAHSSQISGMSWGNWDKHAISENRMKSTTTNLITGSWDHSLKVWDMEKEECLLTLNGSRVITCLDTSYHSHGIVATGHPDCTIRLWDTRATTTASSSSHGTSLAISDKTFKPSHKAFVSAVQWSQGNPYHLASTSHDGTVKLWDIRSSLPLHTVRAFPEGEKGMCMAYGNCSIKNQGSSIDMMIFVGGTDCIVKQFVTE